MQNIRSFSICNWIAETKINNQSELETLKLGDDQIYPWDIIFSGKYIEQYMTVLQEYKTQKISQILSSSRGSQPLRRQIAEI